MTDSTRLAAALADRYRIERELGAGGMAGRATHVAPRHNVACGDLGLRHPARPAIPASADDSKSRSDGVPSSDGSRGSAI